MRDRAGRDLVSRARRYVDRRVLPAIEPLVGVAVPPYRGRRYRAHRMGAYDEWTIVYDLVADLRAPDPALVALALRAAELAAANELTAVAARSDDPSVRRAIGAWPGEHYRMLYALAELTDARTAIDVGTSTGASALALLAAPCVREVHTYDIRSWDSFPDTLLRNDDLAGGLEPHVSDLGQREVFDANADVLAAADLIFVDGPKDGRWEQRFLTLVLSLPISRPQLLVFDDIKVMTMLGFWRDLPLRKCDVTSLGHWSGTGLAMRA